jgi:ADP-ribosylglycohydrolase
MMNEAIANNPPIQSMRYSLSSRFQGVLLGAALGEILGTQCQVVQTYQPQAKQPLSWADISHWGFSNSASATSANSTAAITSGWGHVAVQVAKGLIQGGGGETSWINEVLDVLNIPFEQSNQPLNAEQNLFERNIVKTTQLPQIDAGLAIAALPIALFFHADPHQLEQELQQADKVWQHQSELGAELGDGILALSYALSLALREQLDPTQLIAEVIEELELNRDRAATADPSAPSTPSKFVEQLQFAQTMNQTSLDRATAGIRSLPSKPQPSDTLAIAIAFHCFLNTPEDFSLSVIRAAQLHGNPQTTCLTAALSGAYNGISSIPLNWRSALERGNSEHSPLNRLWGVATATELQQLSDQLLAAWSGAYDLIHLLNYPAHTFAIAAPKVIRPN